MSQKVYKVTVRYLENVPKKLRDITSPNGTPRSSGREFGGRICCDSKTKEVASTGPNVSKQGSDGSGWTKISNQWRGEGISIDKYTDNCPEGGVFILEPITGPFHITYYGKTIGTSSGVSSSKGWSLNKDGSLPPASVVPVGKNGGSYAPEANYPRRIPK